MNLPVDAVMQNLGIVGKRGLASEEKEGVSLTDCPSTSNCINGERHLVSCKLGHYVSAFGLWELPYMAYANILDFFMHFQPYK